MPAPTGVLYRAIPSLPSRNADIVVMAGKGSFGAFTGGSGCVCVSSRATTYNPSALNNPVPTGVLNNRLLVRFDDQTYYTA